MKKLTAIGVVLLLCSITFMAYASNVIRIYVNNEEIRTDVSPQIIDNRVMVPVRFIAESLGADVQWDQEKESVHVDADIKLIASIPEEKIYLYALNEEERQRLATGMYKGLILSINGKKQVFDDWETIAAIEDLPQLQYLDLNGDNKKEIAVILSRGRGTGIAHQTVHIVNPENFTEYKVEDPMDVIKDNIETQIISDREVKIKIGDTVTDVNLKDLSEPMSKGYPEKILDVYYENFMEYEVIESHNTLRANVGVEVGPTDYLGFITIDYSLIDGEFKADKISFKKYASFLR